MNKISRSTILEELTWKDVLLALDLIENVRIEESGLIVLPCIFHVANKDFSLHLHLSGNFKCHICGEGDMVKFIENYMDYYEEEAITYLSNLYDVIPPNQISLFSPQVR